MNLNEDQIEELFYGTTYEEVTPSKPYQQSRWSTFYEQIFKKLEDGTFWRATWSRGSTEMQDNGIEDITIYEVVPVQKTVTVYERIEQ